MQSLSDRQRSIRAHKLQSNELLKGLLFTDILWILEKAIALTLSRAEVVNPDVINRSMEAPQWVHRKSVRDKIGTDPKLREFIDNYGGDGSLNRLHQELVARFGHERSPSENTLRKYRDKYRRSKPRTCPEAEEP
jgi:hypothetical protein